MSIAHVARTKFVVEGSQRDIVRCRFVSMFPNEFLFALAYCRMCRMLLRATEVRKWAGSPFSPSWGRLLPHRPQGLIMASCLNARSAKPTKTMAGDTKLQPSATGRDYAGQLRCGVMLTLFQ